MDNKSTKQKMTASHEAVLDYAMSHLMEGDSIRVIIKDNGGYMSVKCAMLKQSNQLCLIVKINGEDVGFYVFSDTMQKWTEVSK